MDEPKKGNGVMWAVVVVVIALAAYGAYSYMNKDSKEAVVPTPVTTTDTTPVTPVETVVYKDGKYSAVGDYNSPGGAEQIKVDVTLTKGVISGAAVTALATRPESKQWQNKFIQGLQAQVLGKKITEVNLTKVSGSSLTPKGWNDAVAKIQSQSKV